MAKRIYQFKADDGAIICKDNFPCIEINGKLYAIDTRKSNYDKIQKKLVQLGKGELKESISEEDIIMEGCLGKEQAAEIKAIDFSVKGFMDLMIYIQAAVFDITFEEAQARFQKPF